MRFTQNQMTKIVVRVANQIESHHITSHGFRMLAKKKKKKETSETRSSFAQLSVLRNRASGNVEQPVKPNNGSAPTEI